MLRYLHILFLRLVAAIRLWIIPSPVRPDYFFQFSPLRRLSNPKDPLGIIYSLSSRKKIVPTGSVYYFPIFPSPSLLMRYVYPSDGGYSNVSAYGHIYSQRIRPGISPLPPRFAGGFSPVSGRFHSQSLIGSAFMPGSGPHVGDFGSIATLFTSLAYPYRSRWQPAPLPLLIHPSWRALPFPSVRESFDLRGTGALLPPLPHAPTPFEDPRYFAQISAFIYARFSPLYFLRDSLDRPVHRGELSFLDDSALGAFSPAQWIHGGSSLRLPSSRSLGDRGYSFGAPLPSSTEPTPQLFWMDAPLWRLAFHWSRLGRGRWVRWRHLFLGQPPRPVETWPHNGPLGISDPWWRDRVTEFYLFLFGDPHVNPRARHRVFLESFPGQGPVNSAERQYLYDRSFSALRPFDFSRPEPSTLCPTDNHFSYQLHQNRFRRNRSGFLYLFLLLQGAPTSRNPYWTYATVCQLQRDFSTVLLLPAAKSKSFLSAPLLGFPVDGYRFLLRSNFSRSAGAASTPPIGLDSGHCHSLRYARSFPLPAAARAFDYLRAKRLYLFASFFDSFGRAHRLTSLLNRLAVHILWNPSPPPGGWPASQRLRLSQLIRRGFSPYGQAFTAPGHPMTGPFSELARHSRDANYAELFFAGNSFFGPTYFYPNRLHLHFSWGMLPKFNFHLVALAALATRASLEAFSDATSVPDFIHNRWLRAERLRLKISMHAYLDDALCDYPLPYPRPRSVSNLDRRYAPLGPFDPSQLLFYRSAGLGAWDFSYVTRFRFFKDILRPILDPRFLIFFDYDRRVAYRHERPRFPRRIPSQERPFARNPFHLDGPRREYGFWGPNFFFHTGIRSYLSDLAGNWFLGYVGFAAVTNQWTIPRYISHLLLRIFPRPLPSSAPRPNRNGQRPGAPIAAQFIPVFSGSFACRGELSLAVPVAPRRRFFPFSILRTFSLRRALLLLLYFPLVLWVYGGPIPVWLTCPIVPGDFQLLLSVLFPFLDQLALLGYSNWSVLSFPATVDLGSIAPLEQYRFPLAAHPLPDPFGGLIALLLGGVWEAFGDLLTFNLFDWTASYLYLGGASADSLTNSSLFAILALPLLLPILFFQKLLFPAAKLLLGLGLSAFLSFLPAALLAISLFWLIFLPALLAHLLAGLIYRFLLAPTPPSLSLLPLLIRLRRYGRFKALGRIYCRYFLRGPTFPSSLPLRKIYWAFHSDLSVRLAPLPPHLRHRLRSRLACHLAAVLFQSSVRFPHLVAPADSAPTVRYFRSLYGIPADLPSHGIHHFFLGPLWRPSSAALAHRPGSPLGAPRSPAGRSAMRRSLSLLGLPRIPRPDLGYSLHGPSAELAALLPHLAGPSASLRGSLLSSSPVALRTLALLHDPLTYSLFSDVLHPSLARSDPFGSGARRRRRRLGKRLGYSFEPYRPTRPLYHYFASTYDFRPIPGSRSPYADGAQEFNLSSLASSAGPFTVNPRTTTPVDFLFLLCYCQHSIQLSLAGQSGYRYCRPLMVDVPPPTNSISHFFSGANTRSIGTSPTGTPFYRELVGHLHCRQTWFQEFLRPFFYTLLALIVSAGAVMAMPFAWLHWAIAGAITSPLPLLARLRVPFAKIATALWVQFSALLFRGRRYGDELFERGLEQDALQYSSVPWRTSLAISDEDGGGHVSPDGELLEYLGTLFGYSVFYATALLDLFQTLALAAHTRLGFPLDPEHLATVTLTRLLDLRILMARLRLNPPALSPFFLLFLLFGLGSLESPYFQLSRSLGLLRFNPTVYALYALWLVLAIFLFLRPFFPRLHHAIFGHPHYVPGHRDTHLFGGGQALPSHHRDYRYHQPDDSFDRDDLPGSPLATNGYGREGSLDDTGSYVDSMVQDNYSLPFDLDIHTELPDTQFHHSYYFLFSEAATDLNQLAFRPASNLLAAHFSYFFLNFNAQSLAQFSDQLSSIRPLRSSLIRHELRNFQANFAGAIYSNPPVLCSLRGFGRFRQFLENYEPNLRLIQLEATGPDFRRALKSNRFFWLPFFALSTFWERLGPLVLSLFWKVRHRFHLSYSLYYVSLYRDILLARWFPLALGDEPPLSPFLIWSKRYGVEFQMSSDFPPNPTTFQYWYHTLLSGGGAEIVTNRSGMQLDQIDPYLRLAGQSGIFDGTDPQSRRLLFHSRRRALGLLLASEDFLRKLTAPERFSILFRLGRQESGCDSSLAVQRFLESANLPDSTSHDVEEQDWDEPLAFYLFYILLLGYENWSRSAQGLLSNLDLKLSAFVSRLPRDSRLPASPGLDFTPGLRYRGFRRRLYADSVEFPNERTAQIQNYGYSPFHYPFHSPGLRKFRAAGTPDIPRFLRIHPFGGYAAGDLNAFLSGGPFGAVLAATTPEPGKDRDPLAEQLRDFRRFDIILNGRRFSLGFPDRRVPLEYISPRGYSRGHLRSVRYLRSYGYSRFFHPFTPILRDPVKGKGRIAMLYPRWYRLMRRTMADRRGLRFRNRIAVGHDSPAYVSPVLARTRPRSLYKWGTVYHYGYSGHFASSLLAPKSRHRYPGEENSAILPFPFPLPLRGVDSPLGYHASSYVAVRAFPLGRFGFYIDHFRIPLPESRYLRPKKARRFRYMGHFYPRPIFDPRRHGPALKPRFQWVVSDALPRYPSTEDLALGTNDFYCALGTGRRGPVFDYTARVREYVPKSAHKLPTAKLFPKPKRKSPKAPKKKPREIAQDLFSLAINRRRKRQHRLSKARSDFFFYNPNWEFYPPGREELRIRRRGSRPSHYARRRFRFHPVADAYLERHPRRLVRRGILTMVAFKPPQRSFRNWTFSYPYVNEFSHGLNQRPHVIFRGPYDSKTFRSSLVNFATAPTGHLYFSRDQWDLPRFSSAGKFRRWQSLRLVAQSGLVGRGYAEGFGGRRLHLQTKPTSNFLFHSPGFLLSDYYPDIRRIHVPAGRRGFFGRHSYRRWGRFDPTAADLTALTRNFSKYFRRGLLRPTADREALYTFSLHDPILRSRLYALGLPMGSRLASRRTSSERWLLFEFSGRRRAFFSRVPGIPYRAGYGPYGASLQDTVGLPDQGLYHRGLMKFLFTRRPHRLRSYRVLLLPQLRQKFRGSGGLFEQLFRFVDRRSPIRRRSRLYRRIHGKGTAKLSKKQILHSEKVSYKLVEHCMDSRPALARHPLGRNFRLRSAFINDLIRFERRYFSLRHRPLPTGGPISTYSPALYNYLTIPKREPFSFRRNRALVTAFTPSKFLLSRGFLGPFPVHGRNYFSSRGLRLPRDLSLLRLQSALPYFHSFRLRFGSWATVRRGTETTALSAAAFLSSTGRGRRLTGRFRRSVGFDRFRYPSALARSLGHLQFSRITVVDLPTPPEDFGSGSCVDLLRLGRARWPLGGGFGPRPHQYFSSPPVLRRFTSDLHFLKVKRWPAMGERVLRGHGVLRRARAAARVSAELPVSFYDGMRDTHHLTYGLTAARGLDIRFLSRPFRWNLVSSGSDTALVGSLREFFFSQGSGALNLFLYNCMDQYNLFYMVSGAVALFLASPLLITFFYVLGILMGSLFALSPIPLFDPLGLVEFIGFLAHLALDFIISLVAR